LDRRRLNISRLNISRLGYRRRCRCWLGYRGWLRCWLGYRGRCRYRLDRCRLGLRGLGIRRYV